MSSNTPPVIIPKDTQANQLQESLSPKKEGFMPSSMELRDVTIWALTSQL